jgi:RNA-directed DNA polymerase
VPIKKKPWSVFVKSNVDYTRNPASKAWFMEGGADGPGNLAPGLGVRSAEGAAPYQPGPQAFTSLAHYMDLNWLYEAYRNVRKNGAPGVDDVTGDIYAQNLMENLRGLHEHLKSGCYKAPPVRRAEIPKGTSGETRPIGIPTFEDKIVQRAVVMLLEPIYEHNFYGFSYGYRPKRSAHQALEDVWKTAKAVGGGWILEVDLRKFFDTLNHKQLQELVSHRVRDGALRRLIGKWLKAGVMTGGFLATPKPERHKAG